jgi:hypothetical protein
MKECSGHRLRYPASMSAAGTGVRLEHNPLQSTLHPSLTLPVKGSIIELYVAGTTSAALGHNSAIIGRPPRSALRHCAPPGSSRESGGVLISGVFGLYGRLLQNAADRELPIWVVYSPLPI